MTQTFRYGFAFIIGIVLALVYLSSLVTHASAPPGLSASIATSSNPAVSTTAAVVFATSTCNARIITTSASPIMITFSDAQTPTGSYGHLQAASTTVAYDAGQYGCGQERIYSFVAQLITVSESR